MEQKKTGKDWFHDPVLKNEILDLLITPEIRTVFDGTLGLGGHAEAILGKFANIQLYLGSDLDETHLDFAKNRLKKWESKVMFVHTNFSAIKKIIQENTDPRPMAILLDLGLCSTHTDDPGKGFSFMANGPLHMNFEQKSSTNCEKIINESSENELGYFFKRYGEEPLAKKIARKIIDSRKHAPIKTTHQLRSIIEGCTIPQNQKKILTRTFQALRIAVNQELDHLEKALSDIKDIMETGDRIGIISYHSLEDRIVKKYFVKYSRPETQETTYSLHEEVSPAEFQLITRKPIIPSQEEIERNPRARSAKLRIIEKI